MKRSYFFTHGKRYIYFCEKIHLYMVNLHLLISSSFDIIHTLHSSYLCKPVRALFKTIVCHITIPAYTYVLMLEPTKRQILTFVKV